MKKLLLLICLIGLPSIACNETVEQKTSDIPLINTQPQNIPNSNGSPSLGVPNEPNSEHQNENIEQNKPSDENLNLDVHPGEALGDDKQDIGNNSPDLGNDKQDIGNNSPDLGNDKQDIGNNSPDLGNGNENTGGAATSPEPPTVSIEKEKAEPLTAEGLPNLFRIGGELYRSGQPVKNGLTSAQKLGIKTVLSLQLISFDTALDDSESSGLTLIHVPMIPSSVSEEDLIKALKVIHTAEKPVLVHCLHGSDRTGVTVAMYRIVFQNWSKDEAKAEMMEEQFGYHPEFANLLDLIDAVDVDQIRERIFSTDN